MNHHYNDIRSRIPEAPTWFDEGAVPRYCPFTPDECANIYAREVILLRVACQNCGHEFDVCMSWGPMDGVREVLALSKQIETDGVHYGDPPNVDCCPAGPTMNSVPMRVLEFWRQPEAYPQDPKAPRWERVPSLEIEVTPNWAEDRCGA